MNTPRKHHYVPQFYLRNFACDAARTRIETVSRINGRAIWEARSISGIGHEEDLYVHTSNGVPICVEAAINSQVEQPISASDTWKKLSGKQEHLLDKSDKSVLYALVRHLEVRNPHYFRGLEDLSKDALDTANPHYSEDERRMYSFLRANPDVAKAFHNTMSSSLEWGMQEYRYACITVIRAKKEFFTSTNPVLIAPSLPHPLQRLLPGMKPYATILPLTRNAAVHMVIADFGDVFMNIEVSDDVVKGINRHYVGQFAAFDTLRHLVIPRQKLIEEMAWAKYGLVRDTPLKVVFMKSVAIGSSSQ